MIWSKKLITNFSRPFSHQLVNSWPIEPTLIPMTKIHPFEDETFLIDDIKEKEKFIAISM